MMKLNAEKMQQNAIITANKTEARQRMKHTNCMLKVKNSALRVRIRFAFIYPFN